MERVEDIREEMNYSCLGLGLFWCNAAVHFHFV